VGRAVEPSPERQSFGVRLSLDLAMVTSVMVETGVGVTSRGDGDGVNSIGVSPLDAELLDAVLRLVRLIDRPGGLPCARAAPHP